MAGRRDDSNDPSPTPLAVEVAGCSIDAEPYETEWGGVGWRACREAVIVRDGRPVAVELDLQIAVRSTTSTGESPSSWPHDHDDLLAQLTTASVVRAEFNKGGSSITFRLDLAGRRRAVFRPQQINPQTVPRKEVAAYRLNRLLGLDAVPPAAPRRMHRDQLIGRLPKESRVVIPRIDAETCFDAEGYVEGCVAFWVPSVVDSRLDILSAVQTWSHQLGPGGVVSARRRGILRQLSSLLLFDRVIDNVDRFTGGNLLVSPDNQVLYWMDNSYSFAPDPAGHPRCRSYLGRCCRFSRAMVTALRALDPDAVIDELVHRSGLLSADEADALVCRRQVALDHVDRQIELHGDAEVLVFD